MLIDQREARIFFRGGNLPAGYRGHAVRGRLSRKSPFQIHSVSCRNAIDKVHLPSIPPFMTVDAILVFVRRIEPNLFGKRERTSFAVGYQTRKSPAFTQYIIEIDFAVKETDNRYTLAIRRTESIPWRKTPSDTCW
jgi:hypothetical protein